LIQPLVDHVMFSVYCSITCNTVTWNVKARKVLLPILSFTCHAPKQGLITLYPYILKQPIPVTARFKE